MNVASYTVISSELAHPEIESKNATIPKNAPKKKFDLLRPLRHWIDNLKVKDPQLARHLCYLIPAQCPFERDVKVLGRTLFHIPPMCKINPLYEELMMLRFRALCYLADECGEDISAYC
ncbi:Mo-dependent nitrogenase C-terminal domain-containing protein [Lusitaniella coriacea]